MARQTRWPWLPRGLRAVGEGEVEHGAAAGAWLEPDAAAVALDDAPAQRQADAAARVLVAGVQPLEHLEHLPGAGAVHADAAVGHGDLPGALVAPGGQLDLGRPARRGELRRVGAPVLQRPQQLRLVAPAGR